MAILLPLPPLGLGTGEVESFPSYFARLAEAHVLSPIKLMRLLVDRRLRDDPRSACPSETLLYSNKGIVLAGYTAGSDDFVSMVEKATGNSTLKQMTYSFLRQCGDPSHCDALRESRAWCPACLWESQKYDVPFYDRLLWALKNIVRCPMHRLTLATRCPSCSYKQRYYNKSSNNTICWKCSASLATTSEKWMPELIPSLGEADCIGLTAAAAEMQQDYTVRNVFDVFIVELNRKDPEKFLAVANILKKQRTKQSCPRNTIVTFDSMLKIALLTSIPLAAILSDPAGCVVCTRPFDRIGSPIGHFSTSPLMAI